MNRWLDRYNESSAFLCIWKKNCLTAEDFIR